MFSKFDVVRSMVEPLIKGMLKLEHKDGLSVVVFIAKKETPFEDLVPAWAQSFGRKTSETERVAIEKARTSWRTGYPSRMVMEKAWMLAEDNECIWPGAIVFTNDATGVRVVSAVSGLTGRHDEFLAETILSAIDTVSDDMMLPIMNSDGIYRI